MKKELYRYFIYLVRWQLSTPILAVCLVWFNQLDKLSATVIANLIGGLIFYWIDKYIFSTKYLSPIWEVKYHYECDECETKGVCFRLVKSKNYDKTNAKAVFLCEKCSEKKANDLRDKGIIF